MNEQKKTPELKGFISGCNNLECYHERVKKMAAQVVEQPVTRPFPQQRHLVTALRTV
jgi:hypothetical protein